MSNEARRPRVLFVSVNPFSETSNNGKTFASFFRGYPQGSIAQLYFHRELPSSRVSSNYFRITDEDLLRALPFPSRTTGERVSPASETTSPVPQSLHTVLKSSPTVRLLRLLLWTRVSFRDPSLLEWADAFSPEIVVFCGSDVSFLYSKVASLADRYSAKLVLYVTDDYVLPVSSRNLSIQLARQWSRHVFLKMCRRASLVLTIGDRMSETYKRKYGVASKPVMNMVELPGDQPPPRSPVSPSEPLILTYAGSFHSGRAKVLSDLVDCAERLTDRGVPVEVRVFGPTEVGVEQMLHRPPCGRFGGLLNGSQLAERIRDTDVLVHAESDDPKNMAATALSISTKIPEYLASGRCVLAIGPLAVASMDYLASGGAALTVEPGDPDALDAAVMELASSAEYRTCLAEKGFELARQNHDGVQIRAAVWQALEDLAR